MSPSKLTFWIIANLAVLAAGLMLAFGGDVRTAQFPQRPIKLVVPFGPGGGTDTYARIIKKGLEEADALPQPLVIVNRGGAGATIGSRYVMNAPPDGYTMLILHDALMTAQASGVVPYGPEAFDPVAATGEVGMVITVGENSPYEDLADLMNDATRRPGEVSFGANMGAVTHFVGLQLERLWPGAQFRYVQVGGGAQRFSDLLGGHIDATGFSIEEFVRFRDAGLKGLAYFGPARHPAAEDVPTALEQGLPLVSRNTFYWWVPKGTPPERIAVLAEALRKATETDYVQRQMARIHHTPIFLEGEELRERIAATVEEMGGVRPQETVDLPNIPAIVGVATLGLALAVGVQSARRRRFPFSGTPKAASADGPTPGISGRWLAVIGGALTTAYAVVLSLSWLDFRLATGVYVLALGATLSRFAWARLPALALLAQSLAFGLHFLFTQVFVVDLP